MTDDTIITNNPVVPESLPEGEALAYQALEAGYATMLRLILGLVTLQVAIVFTGALVFVPKLSGLIPVFLPFAALGLIAATIFVWLGYHHAACGYALRERDLHYKHGVLWRTVLALPFGRVQHVEVERGPLERLFGLSTLKFFTAGGGSADMKIPGLAADRANKLRNFVLAQADTDDDQF